MKLIIINLCFILILSACSYNENSMLLGSFKKDEISNTVLGMINVESKNNFNSKRCVFLYKIKDNSELFAISDREKILQGINPWTMEKFDPQGIKTFSIEKKSIIDIKLTQKEQKILNLWAFKDITTEETKLIFRSLYDQLPIVSVD